MYRRLKLSNASSDHEKINEVKREICINIRRLAYRKRLNQKMLARYIGTSEANVSRVIRHRFDQISVNQLFRYLTILEPNFRILISI